MSTKQRSKRGTRGKNRKFDPIYDRVFPVNKKSKRPITDNGHHDASADPKQWEEWEREYPNCGWGSPTSSERFLLDVDPRHGGDKSWQELITEHGPVDTRTIKTQHGGFHYYFQAPPGVMVPSDNNGKFAPGVDVKGEGGYGIMPPTTGYKVVNNAPVAEAPDWVIKKILEMKTSSKQEKFILPEYIPAGKRNSTLFKHASSLQSQGKSDEEIREALYKARDENTEQPDDNPTTDEELERMLTQIFKYPKGTGKYRSATPEEYRQQMLRMGYTFKMHMLDDRVYINNEPISDAAEMELLFNMGNAGYTSREKVRQAFNTEAMRHPYHPIREYFLGLRWDGEDHISKVASYVEDEEGMFTLFFRKWLIGSVAKVLPETRGYQNRTLVLVGDQKVGKSSWVRWLASPFREYYIEKGINPTNKDDQIKRATNFVWEIGELGAVTRKADREALKTFQSEETVKERAAYGRYDLHKPVLANYIGTINDEGTGFLNDPTGSRRYMASTIKRINWDYAKDVNIDQVWAQAVHLLLVEKEAWNLSYEEEIKANEINDKYETENPLEGHILRYFCLDPDDTENLIPTSEVMRILKEQGVISQIDKSSQTMVGTIMKKHGIKKEKKTLPGYAGRPHCYIGVSINPNFIPGYVRTSVYQIRN